MGTHRPDSQGIPFSWFPSRFFTPSFFYSPCSVPDPITLEHLTLDHLTLEHLTLEHLTLEDLILEHLLLQHLILEHNHPFSSTHTVSFGHLTCNHSVKQRIFWLNTISCLPHPAVFQTLCSGSWVFIGLFLAFLLSGQHPSNIVLLTFWAPPQYPLPSPFPIPGKNCSIFLVFGLKLYSHSWIFFYHKHLKRLLSRP